MSPDWETLAGKGYEPSPAEAAAEHLEEDVAKVVPPRRR